MAKKTQTPIEYYKANMLSMKRMFPGINNIVKELETYPQLSHASNILTKAVNIYKGKKQKRRRC